MKRAFVKAALTFCLCLFTMSCGDDIEPVELFYDSDGFVFFENGKNHPATTQFTSSEMLQHLVTVAWKRDFAFYYDKNKAGNRKDGPAYSEKNFFVFSTDGTVYMGNVNNVHSRIDGTYTISDRTITVRLASESYAMHVAAIDDTLMVVDTPLAGQNIYGYDDATCMQRTVFKRYNLINSNE